MLLGITVLLVKDSAHSFDHATPMCNIVQKSVSCAKVYWPMAFSWCPGGGHSALESGMWSINQQVEGWLVTYCAIRFVKTVLKHLNGSNATIELQANPGFVVPMSTMDAFLTFRNRNGDDCMSTYGSESGHLTRNVALFLEEMNLRRLWNLWPHSLQKFAWNSQSTSKAGS